jgi:hypothetical protein
MTRKSLAKPQRSGTATKAKSRTSAKGVTADGVV